MAAETEMRSETWDVGLKQTNTWALKLSTVLLLLFLELKICVGIFLDKKQSRNRMKCISTIQQTKVASAGARTRQLTFGVENTLLFYHIWVSSKCRSLRPFCSAHLGLFWENNDTYWVTNVPHNKSCSSLFIKISRIMEHFDGKQEIWS